MDSDNAVRVAFALTPKICNETTCFKAPSVRAPCGRWNSNSVDFVTVGNRSRGSVNVCADLDKSPGKSSHLPGKNVCSPAGSSYGIIGHCRRRARHLQRIWEPFWRTALEVLRVVACNCSHHGPGKRERFACWKLT